MPDQRDVQQLIQSLTPSAVNNGNPNTVYNQPQPQGGYIPPTFDPGTNTWRINPAPAPSNVNWQQMSANQPQTWGWQAPAQPAPPVIPNGPLPTTPTTPVPTTPVPAPVGGGSSVSPGGGVPGNVNGNLPGSHNSNSGTQFYDTGCVVIDSYLSDYDRADEVEVGDEMFVIDPISYRKSVGKVSYSETKLMPCVRIMTESGITLDCSTTAPIADQFGEQILAPNLLNKLVPVCDNGYFFLDRVTSIEDLGELEVRHITVEDNYFLAGKEKGRFFFHHNIKFNGIGVDLLGLAEARDNNFGWGSSFVGGVAGGGNTQGAMQANGTWDAAHGGTSSNPATAWGQAQAGYTPTGQGLTDAFGNPTSGATDESGYMTDAWGGLGNSNVDTWDTSWMQPAAAGSNIPTMPTVQATPSGGGMYDYQNTAPEANDTGGFLDKAVNWFDNTVLNNFYDETTNSWNKGNIGWSVLSALTGMPLEDQVQRTSLNNLFTDGGMGSDYARTQTQQAYDRSDAAKREAMVTNLAQKYDKTPQEVLQIIGRAQ